MYGTTVLSEATSPDVASDETERFDWDTDISLQAHRIIKRNNIKRINLFISPYPLNSYPFIRLEIINIIFSCIVYFAQPSPCVLAPFNFCQHTVPSHVFPGPSPVPLFNLSAQYRISMNKISG